MTVDERQGEVDQLRARVAELERQLAEQAERTNRAVAAAQDRAYWLDRWHLDLNALMRRRGADEFRAFLRLVRAVAYRIRKIRRKLRI
jgi:Viral A-type inclusion protein repeat